VNEQQLRRLFRRLVLLSAPVPLAFLGAACGGTTTHESEETGGSSGTGASGGTVHQGTSGSGGTVHQGAGGSGGTDVVVGTGGAGPLGGSGGAGATGGSGGGAVTDCKGSVQLSGCMPVTSTLPRQCVTPEQAAVGQALPNDKCLAFCNQGLPFCVVNAVDEATVSVLCEPGCAVGRRPAGLGESPRCDSRAAGSYFAEIAQLEAASVTAFRILRDELRASGAPEKLVRAAARAARDEVRHARSTGALARRFGAVPRKPSLEPRPLRSVEAVAVENAIEGCVRETFGALLATRQAAQARDPVVRATMMRIARDETQHASLAWRVARFLDTKLGPEGRRRVERARRAAASELLANLANEPALAFADVAGLPSPAEALRLANELNRALWS
jgi:hypothetical protein